MERRRKIAVGKQEKEEKERKILNQGWKKNRDSYGTEVRWQVCINMCRRRRWHWPFCQYLCMSFSQGGQKGWGSKKRWEKGEILLSAFVFFSLWRSPLFENLWMWMCSLNVASYLWFFDGFLTLLIFWLLFAFFILIWKRKKVVCWCDMRCHGLSSWVKIEDLELEWKFVGVPLGG